MTMQRDTPWLALGLLTLTLTGCRADGDPDAPTSVETLLEGRSNVNVQTPGGPRRVLTYRPPGLPDGPSPLIIVLHGGFGSGIGALERYGFEAAADENGFVVVTPDGSGVFQTWNAGECCGDASRNDVDDVRFIRNLIQRLSAIEEIDPDRVYVTGMSNGAAMAYRLACEAADVIAAIAPVSGSQSFTPCEPSEPVAVAHLHGALDTHIPAEGGVGDDAVLDVEWPDLESQFEAWRAHNACGPPEITRTGEVNCRRSPECSDGALVELCVVEEMGHQWPPVDIPIRNNPTSDAINATDYVVDFLLAQRR